MMSEYELDATFSDPLANSDVESLAIQADGKILIAGRFTSVSGSSAPKVARLHSDGTRDVSFAAPDPYGAPLRKLELQSDGKVITTGYFSSPAATMRLVSRFLSDGTPDPDFTAPEFYSPQYTPAANRVVAMSDGRILVGGYFASVDGAPCSNLVRLLPDGSRDPSFSDARLEGDVRELTVQPDGKILVGGNFTAVAGIARGMVARLNEDGSLDASFADPQVENGAITALSVQGDGKVLVGGTFSSVGGSAVRSGFRLNSNGTVDSTLSHLNMGSATIRAFMTQGDGKIIITGGFVSVGGVPRGRVARLNPDLSHDDGFTTPEFSYDPLVIASQDDGKLLFAGGFYEVGGSPMEGVARLQQVAPPEPFCFWSDLTLASQVCYLPE